MNDLEKLFNGVVSNSLFNNDVQSIDFPPEDLELGKDSGDEKPDASFWNPASPPPAAVMAKPSPVSSSSPQSSPNQPQSSNPLKNRSLLTQRKQEGTKKRVPKAGPKKVAKNSASKSSKKPRKDKGKVKEHHVDIFINDEAEEIYDGIRIKDAHFQQKFNVSHPELTQVHATVIERGWTKLIDPPKVGNGYIVREFYANLKATILLTKGSKKSKPRPKEVVIRETTVDISPAAIARELEIPNDGTDTQMCIADDLSTIAEYISATVETPPWVPGEKRKVISPKHLKPHLQVWNRIIHDNLQPSLRSHQITLDRIDTLYRIASGRPVSVGHLIWKSMLDTADNKRYTLVFPQLITALCERAGVPRLVDDAPIQCEDSEWDWETQKREDRAAAHRVETKAKKKRKQDGLAGDANLVIEQEEEAAPGVENEGYEVFEEEIMEKGLITNRKLYSAFNRLYSKIRDLISGVREKIDVVEAANLEHYRAQSEKIETLAAMIRESEAKRLEDEARHRRAEAAIAARFMELEEVSIGLHQEAHCINRQFVKLLSGQIAELHSGAASSATPPIVPLPETAPPAATWPTAILEAAPLPSPVHTYRRVETKAKKKRKQDGLEGDANLVIEQEEEAAPGVENEGYEVFEEEIMEKGLITNRKLYSAFNRLYSKIRDLISGVREKIDVVEAANLEHYRAQSEKIETLAAMIRESEAKRLEEEARHRRAEAAIAARFVELEVSRGLHQEAHCINR